MTIVAESCGTLFCGWCGGLADDGGDDELW